MRSQGRKKLWRLVLVAATVAWVSISQVACIPFGDARFNFEGIVSDPSGKPIPGASVTVFVDGKIAGDRSTAITDANGHYEIFEGSCPCEFRFELVVTKAGYREARIPKTAKEANSMKRLDVTLKRSVKHSDG